MAIYITGDTHGEMDIAKLARINFDDAGMTREDYVIILGDFGFPWILGEGRRDRRWLDWLDDRPWTTLFIDGNHENFQALNRYPVDDWHGGSVRRLRDNVMHLRRGEVFDIDGRTFFTMGGARSVDRAFRAEGISWWPEEVPNADVRALAEAKVAEVGEVDYVLTHCPPTEALLDLSLRVDIVADPDDYNDWLQEEVADRLKFRQWFYGHMHLDRWYWRPYTPLYDVIYDLDDTGRTPYGPSSLDDDSFLDALSELYG